MKFFIFIYLFILFIFVQFFQTLISTLVSAQSGLNQGDSQTHLFQDHDVQEDKIFLLSLLMAEMGVHSVAYAFPKVRIITTAVDKNVNDEFHIIPGIGKSSLIKGIVHTKTKIHLTSDNLTFRWVCFFIRTDLETFI